MLSNYLEMCFLLLGLWILLTPHFAPWVGYICGAFMVVLSLVKVFGN